METKLWIVGRVMFCHKDGKSGWEFAGVFDSEEKAVEACKDVSYFVGPAILNKSLPLDTTKWEGAYYPRNQGEKNAD